MTRAWSVSVKSLGVKELLVVDCSSDAAASRLFTGLAVAMQQLPITIIGLGVSHRST